MSQKALVVTRIASPMVLTTRPIPTPGPKEILVKVSVAGINPHDSYARDLGLFIADSLPSPLGIDVVGTITAVGADVTGFTTGDHVFGVGNPLNPDEQATQEYAVLSTSSAAVVPTGISDDEAATLSLNPLTAYVALFGETSGLGLPAPHLPGSRTFDYAKEKLVVIGGGSACGKFAVSWAALVGIGTVVVVGGVESHLRALGATHVVDRHGSPEAVIAEVRRFAGDDLVYVLDCVGAGPGGQTLGARFLSSKANGTLVVLVGAGTVDESQLGGKVFERKFVQLTLYFRGAFMDGYWKALPGWIERGVVKPTRFSVIEGLDAGAVNEALDGYVGRAAVVKPNVHL